MEDKSYSYMLTCSGLPQDAIGPNGEAQELKKVIFACMKSAWFVK